MNLPRLPSHPGEILMQDFLVPRGLTQTTLANALGISVTRVNEIVKGKRGVTAETAWMLAGAFGTSPEFWGNLQMAYDLARARPALLVKKLPTNGATNGSRR
jgi:antitoxin HigA-1